MARSRNRRKGTAEGGRRRPRLADDILRSDAGSRREERLKRYAFLDGAFKHSAQGDSPRRISRRVALDRARHDSLVDADRARKLSEQADFLAGAQSRFRSKPHLDYDALGRRSAVGVAAIGEVRPADARPDAKRLGRRDTLEAALHDDAASKVYRS